MNVLDENIIASQRRQLQRWRIPFRQIGHELANQGIKDPQIIPLLRRLKQPTFFTRDYDYHDPKLCDQSYCLAWLNVRPDQAASFIRRFLRHSVFRTHRQRLGTVVRIHPEGIECWRRSPSEPIQIKW